MNNLDLLHFEQLKSEIQSRYLENHTPSDENISNWKGIDIVYFQEDLRKATKGNISEKSFYTYFKATPVAKIPRIDILNILSIYAGYVSWYDFKKNHLFVDEILNEYEESLDENLDTDIEDVDDALIEKGEFVNAPSSSVQESTVIDVDKGIQESSPVIETKVSPPVSVVSNSQPAVRRKSLKDYAWLIVSAILLVVIGFLGFNSQVFDSTYTYHFVDADRNAKIQDPIQVKVIKKDESPIYYSLKPGEDFSYPTKDQVLRMEISSPLYESIEINRNLASAPREETIQLRPDDYKMAVNFFSTMEISGNPEESALLIKQKRRELESRIAVDAIIYQVFDNDIYGVETLDRQKYINLVTTPTTSLKNLDVIDIKREKGKIILIKFKINDETE